MEHYSVIGVLLGIFSVVGGALLEGLHLGAILQPTAAVIVFGGTLGATLVAFPTQDVRLAISMLGRVFQTVEIDTQAVIDEIIEVANIARKEGILAIEQIRSRIQDPLFKKGLKFVIDGFEPQAVRDILQSEIDMEAEDEEAAGRVWEGAGGFAPTIGIIGAVLGLIHVMGNLSDPSKLGEGIAVAFVATVYGVASANLFFIPFGNKLKRKAEMRAMAKEVVKLGVSGIQEGANPHFLREKLEVYARNQFKGSRANAQAETPASKP